MPTDVAILIPARDAAGSLGQVLVELAQAMPGLPVLVVDDGSLDSTAQVARDGGAELFTHLHSQGKGAALRRGWDLLFTRGHQAVLSLDADGQHDPAEGPSFVQLWREASPDLILGDRGLGRTPMAWDRRLSNRLSTALLAWRTGLPLRDSQCGYRLLDHALWRRLRLRSRAFDLESEVLLQAAVLGATLRHVPVTQRASRAGSHIHRVPDSARFLAKVLGAQLMEGEHELE